MTSETSALGYATDDYGCDDSPDTAFDACTDAADALASGANSLFQTSPFSYGGFGSGMGAAGGLGLGGGFGMLGGGPISGLSGFLGGANSNYGAGSDVGVAQLSSVLHKIASMLPSTLNGANQSSCGQSPFASGDQKFSDFQASSVGDPHDAFTGTTVAGAANGRQTFNDHWDDMRSHQDLLHSNSFKGGIRIATQTTEADANGKTMNGKVTVHLNNERDAVSLDADGNTVLSQNGHWKSLKPGSTVTLADGSVISEADDHSLSIRKKSDQGEITTLLKTNGDGGVDVNVGGKNARVGGYLARHATAA